MDRVTSLIHTHRQRHLNAHLCLLTSGYHPGTLPMNKEERMRSSWSLRPTDATPWEQLSLICAKAVERKTEGWQEAPQK